MITDVKLFSVDLLTALNRGRKSAPILQRYAFSKRFPMRLLGALGFITTYIFNSYATLLGGLDVFIDGCNQ